MRQPKLIPTQRDDGVWEYQLVEDYAFQVAGQDIAVPPGFGYDGATIPSIAWQAIYSPFDPVVMGPALVHDWLYHAHGNITREQADLELRDLLIGNGVPENKAQVIYAAVRVFGEHYWLNTPADLAYLKTLYHRLAASPHVQKYRFPLNEMGIA
jgi:hypothetical protein